MEFDLVQPTLRRQWHLRRAGDVAAILHVPAFRRGATATVGAASWRIEGTADCVVRDDRTGAELARLRTHRGRCMLEVGDHAAAWERRGNRAVAVDRSGVALVHATLRPRLLRWSGTVRVRSTLPDRGATAAALLACYVLIRATEQAAAAAAAAAAA